jgi:AcrR family transcriptional regulator
VTTRLRRADQVERNREFVLDAARRVFLDKGYARATVEAIAEEAGFSTGVVYSQFGSKADLFLALLDRRIAERAAANARRAARLVGHAGVRALLREAMRDAELHPGWPQLLIEFRTVAARDPGLHERYAAAHERTVAELVAVLEQLHHRASARPAVPLRSMAQFIIALGSGIALERAVDPGALPDRDVIAMVPRAVGLSEA